MVSPATMDPGRSKLRHRRHVGGFGAFGRFIVRFRWYVIALWLIVPIALTMALPSLGSQVNSNQTAFLPPTAPSVAAAALVSPIIGPPAAASVIIVITSSSPMTAKEAALATAAVRPRVAAVHGVTATDPAVLSGNGLAVQFVAQSQVSQFDQVAVTNLVNGVVAATDNAPLPSGIQANVAGATATNAAIEASNKSAGSTEIFSILFIIVLLLLIFRSPLAPVVTLLPALFALVLAGPIIGGLGQSGVIKVSMVAQLLLIVLVLGAGTDYGLFLVFRVREELEHGRDKTDAVATSLARVGESITASAATVIAALLSLLLATFVLYKDLAVPLAIGVAAILLAGLTLLPALLAVLGNAVFWPTHPSARAHRDGLWGRVAQRFVARPARTLVIGIVFLLALSVGALFLKDAGFGGQTTAPAGTSAAIGSASLSANFPEAASNPTNLIFRFASPIWSSAAEVEQLQRDLKASGQFTTLVGPLNPMGVTLGSMQFEALHSLIGPPQLAAHLIRPPTGVSAEVFAAYRADVRYVSRDGKTIQFESELTAGDPASTAALNAVPEIRATVAAKGAAVGAIATGVAGEAPGLYDVSSTSSSDLRNIIPVAVLAIGLVLAIVLRSLMAPFYLVVSVVLSYTASLGLSVIVFQWLGGSSGITFLLPFLLFLFLLALGEDYNILVMTRIREENTHMPLHEAIVNAVGATGPTITSAGLVLAGTFGVLAVAGGANGGGAQVTVIGAGLAAGILLDTFVVRTLLVPSTVALLGRWNWWPSKLWSHPALHHD